MKFLTLAICIILTIHLEAQDTIYVSYNNLSKPSLEYKNRIALAIMTLESMKGKYLYNPDDTLSSGWYGMRHIYILEVNHILGFNRFTDADRFDFVQSTLLFFYYNDYYIPDWDYRKIALLHCAGFAGLRNPSINTLNYWDKIKQILNTK